jgi:hypothetical protein
MGDIIYLSTFLFYFILFHFISVVLTEVVTNSDYVEWNENLDNVYRIGKFPEEHAMIFI